MVRIILLWIMSSLLCLAANAQVIHNGIPWFDEQGNIINAHGACIVEDGGRYWLFGEYKSDESNAFPGFGCYSSADLVNWRFERIVLPVQKDGILGPDRVGERVKVMKCPKTGEYVMLMHADDLGYNDPYIGIATSPTINGDYTLHGPILFDGKPLRHWDMGTFQDTDGKGYLLIHHGPIYRLSDDYRSIEAKLAIPEYWNAWNAAKAEKKLSIQGREQVHNWISDKKGDCLEREFDGGRIAVVGKTDGNGGYATISISYANGKVLDKLFVDFYSKIPDEGLRFVSKNYPKGKYRLRIEVTGTQSAWYNKKKTIRYGSHGYLVNVTKTIEMEADV